jgi:nicotinate-nucleotide adenylyltransferase
MKKNKNIILYGGSFDPPHFGHLHLAKLVSKIIRKIKVIVVPCNINPLKKKVIASNYHRFNMLNLLFEESNLDYHISNYEIQKEGPSFSVDTILYFKEKYENLFFLMGEDSFLSLKKWKNYRRILGEVSLIVASRKTKSGLNDYISSLFDEYEIEYLKNNLYILKAKGIKPIYFTTSYDHEASSSKIRKQLKDGLLPQHLSESVLQYIEENKLYKD